MSEAIFKVTEHTVPASHIREYPGSTSGSQEAVLNLHVKQYTPLDQTHSAPDDGITLIAAHGVGFPKVRHFSCLRVPSILYGGLLIGGNLDLGALRATLG